MHSTGNYIKAAQSFTTEFWGQRTALFMEYITKDLAEWHWDGIFRGLAAMSKKVDEGTAIATGAPLVP